MYQELSKTWENFDGLVHSIGFAPANELDGNFVDVATREVFKLHMILARSALPRLLRELNHS